MTDPPAHPASDDQDTLDSDLLAQLACPVCYGELRLEGSRLRCVGCSRGYPIADGIPVMIIEHAGRLGEES